MGLVGVGENEYGHPTDAALAIVRDAGGVALRTDELGTVALSVGGEQAGEVRVWSERVGAPP